MKKLLPLIMAFCFLGCRADISPFSPKSAQQVQNSGEIGEITNNTGGILAEMGNINQRLDVMGSKLHDIQEGLVNIKMGGNENSGVQILSGDGALIVVFALCCMGMLLFYFYKEKKINQILAAEIKNRGDQTLHENVIKAAAYTFVEKDIYNRIYK
jgi:hypothetical protein